MADETRKKGKMPLPMLVVLVICVVVLGVSIWQLSTIFLEYKAGTDEYDKLQTYVSGDPAEEVVQTAAEDGENADDTEAEDAWRSASCRLRIPTPWDGFRSRGRRSVIR